MAVLSTDLRQRVVETYEKTKNKRQVCFTFNIARTTLDRWLKLKQQTGSLAQQDWKHGPDTLIQDWDAFTAFVKQSKFDTIKQLVPLYEQCFAEPIHYERLRRAMRKIGWTNKKRVSPINKQIQSNKIPLDY